MLYFQPSVSIINTILIVFMFSSVNVKCENENRVIVLTNEHEHSSIYRVSLYNLQCVC